MTQLKYEWHGICPCGEKVSLNENKAFHACRCSRHYYTTPDYFVRCIIDGLQDSYISICIMKNDEQ